MSIFNNTANSGQIAFSNQPSAVSRRHAGVSAGAVAATLPLIAVGAFDTIGQSVGLVDDNDVEKWVKSVNSFSGDLYKDNKSGYRAAGDIATMFGGVGAISKSLRGSSYLARGLGSFGNTGKIASKILIKDDVGVNNLVSKLAKKEALLGKAGLRNTSDLAEIKRLKRQVRVKQGINDAKDAAGAEAFILTAQNQSELFFPEGQSTGDVIAMSALGFGIGGALGQLMVTPAIRKAVKVGGEEASKRGDLYTGHAGTDILTATRIKEELASGLHEDSIRFASDSTEQFNLMKANAQRVIDERATELLQNSPIPSVTKGSKPAANGEVKVPKNVKAVGRMLESLALTEPKFVANLESLEAIELYYDYSAKTTALTTKLSTELTEVQNKLKSTKDSIEVNSLNSRAKEINTQLTDIGGNLIPVKINRLGQKSSDISNPSIFENNDYKVSVVVPKKVGGTNDAIFNKPISYISDGTRQAKGIGVDGTLFVGNKTVSTALGMSKYEGGKFYAAMPRSLDRLGKVLEDDAVNIKQVTKIKNNGTVPYQTLDYILEAVKRFGHGTSDFSALSKVLDLSEFGSVDEIMYASLQAKYNDFRRILQTRAGGLRKSGVLSDDAGDIGERLFLKFNDDYGSHNYGLSWFSDLHANGVNKIGNNFKEAMEDFTNHFGLSTTSGTAAEVLKDQANAGRKLLFNDGWIEKLKNTDNVAVTAMLRTNNIADNYHMDFSSVKNAANVFEDLRQARLIEDIAELEHGELLRLIEEQLQGSPEILKAMGRGADELSQGVADSPVVGALGQIAPTTLDFRMRHVVGSGATSVIGEVVQRVSKQVAKRELKDNTGSLGKLFQKANVESATRYLHYHSAMQKGWNLADGVADDLGRFALATDELSLAKNQKIAKQAGLDAVPEFLPEPVTNNAALRMDKLSLEALAEIKRFSDIRYSIDNVLNKSLGRVGIQYRVGHTIEPSRYGQEMVFITDQNGHVVQYVTGSSQAVAKSRAQKLLNSKQKELTAKGESSVLGITTKESTAEWKIANQQAWNSSNMDVSDAWQHTSGSKARGERFVIIDDVNFIQAQLEEIGDMYSEMGQRYTATKFSGMLNSVNEMQKASNVQKQGVANFITGQSDEAFDDVFDMFTQQLLNTSKRNTGSLYGSVGLVAEQAFDASIGKVYDILGVTGARGSQSKSAQSAYETIAKEHGFDPQEYALQGFERGIGTSMPFKTKQILKAGAGFTQAMALKLFEVSHAALTMASIFTTTPHAVRFYGRLKNESDKDYVSRVGYVGDMLSNADALPNPSKLTLSVMMKKMNGNYRDVLKEASDLGYTNAHVAEFIDDIATPAQGKVKKAWRSFDKYAGLASTKSEEYARTIAFLTGYELFHGVGKQGKRISMAAANDLANKAIADYRPHQRAEIFKGASGIPLAMFQTFAINYFQRMASAIESKSHRALFTQLGTQAFVFGGQALPGFDMFNEMMFSNWDGTQRPEDLLKHGFEGNIGDLLAYGTISNLPKMFGADDGLALYTRGEMQIPRNVTPLNIFNTPFFSMVGRSKQALTDGFKAALQNPEVGGGHALREAAIYSVPNRPIKGMLEMFQGYSTNRNGDIVADDLKMNFQGVARMVGMKPVREAEQAALMWRDRQTQLAQRAKIKSLRASVEALQRSGKTLDGDKLASVMEKYIAYGGSPEGFKGWYKRTLMKAQFSKFDREVLRKLGTNKRGIDVQRYLELTDEE